MTEPIRENTPRGPGSFCIPRITIEALLDAQATAYEICTYLVLAKHTDATGLYSTAAIKAVNKATGGNKTKTGPINRAIERLKTIRAKKKVQVSNGRPGKSHKIVEEDVDLGPIIFDRETWLAQGCAPLPDGPTERGKILFILPDFAEPAADRVWFGNNLVTGVGEFNKPLKELKNAGDEAARLLLSLYTANDMETWGGVRPVGRDRGPWSRYEPVDDDVPLGAGARLIRAKCQGPVAPIDSRISGGNNEAYWSALRALESAGFVYEVVLVLNRNAIKRNFLSGEEYGRIPDDAEPLYELDCRSAHGYKPIGEEGLSGVTANTAGALGYPVTLEGGRFDKTYAGIVRAGYPAMIAGLYRLRYRVANPKNAGVKGAWARIYENNQEAFELIQRIRTAHALPPLPQPGTTAFQNEAPRGQIAMA